MRLQDSPLLGAAVLARIGIQGCGGHSECRESVSNVRAGKSVDEAATVAFTRSIDTIAVDAVFLLHVVQEIVREANVVNIWVGVSWAL